MISTDTPANVIQRTGSSHKSLNAILHEPRSTAIAWLSVYLAASGLALGVSGHPRLMSAHALALVIAGWSSIGRGRLALIVGDLLPLLVAPILYVEIPALIAALGSSYHDVLIQRWEVALFGSHPSRVLATIMPNLALSEILHLGYLAYYPAILVPPLALYARRNRTGYAQTVLALTAAYVICWTLFAVMPVQGPRYLWTPNAPNGPARHLAVTILASGSSRGAAFPSSHMAVMAAQTVMALRWQPRLGAVLAVVSVLVGVGAVYGGFHYGVDMLAGAVLGLTVAGGTLLMYREIES